MFNSVFGGLFVFLQVQSFTEYFQSDCTDSIAWLNGPNYFTAITEGWAAYNEYELFPNYTTLYDWDSNQQGHKDIMKQKYGMLYYQVLETVIISDDLRQIFDTSVPNYCERFEPRPVPVRVNVDS